MFSHGRLAFPSWQAKSPTSPFDSNPNQNLINLAAPPTKKKVPNNNNNNNNNHFSLPLSFQIQDFNSNSSQVLQDRRNENVLEEYNFGNYKQLL